MAKKEIEKEVTVATVNKVLEGKIIAKTAKPDNILTIIVEVPGVYSDFELGDKVEIKK